MTALTLPLDSCKRICLSKLFDDTVRSVRAYRQNGKVILEPLVEIPAREAWLFKNKNSLARVRRGLSQMGMKKRGSGITDRIKGKSPSFQ